MGELFSVGGASVGAFKTLYMHINLKKMKMHSGSSLKIHATK